IFSNQNCSFASDVYAVGCILQQIVTRSEVPWSKWFAPSVIKEAIVKNSLQPSINIYNELENLITQCLQQEPNKRPSMVQVLNTLDEILINTYMEIVVSSIEYFDKHPEQLAELNHKVDDQEDTEAQYILGSIYYTGGEVFAQNFEKAFELYSKAADQGHLCAQYNIATMYTNGIGVSQNIEKAMDYYFKLSDQGFSVSVQALAFMYEHD